MMTKDQVETLRNEIDADIDKVRDQLIVGLSACVNKRLDDQKIRLQAQFDILTRVLAGPRERKIYSVWMEGYSTNGNAAQAQFMGEAIAYDFNEAVKNILIMKEWDLSHLKYGNPPTYWGCKLFDNEKDARRAFG